MTEKITFLGVDLSDRNKANFLSRFFGVFYEDPIGHCLESKGFKLKGRPSVYNKNEQYLHKTYDYTVEKNGNEYIVEAKCWIAYENFKHYELTLDLLRDKWDDPKQKGAFQLFLELGSIKEPYKKYKFYYDEEAFTPVGKILIWAKVNKSEVEKLKKKYKFTYIFSIEDMIKEIREKNKDYYKYINDRKKWANELFQALRENNLS